MGLAISLVSTVKEKVRSTPHNPTFNRSSEKFSVQVTWRRTVMADRDGGPWWRTVMADRDGGPWWRTVMADRDGGPCGGPWRRTVPRTVTANRDSGPCLGPWWRTVTTDVRWTVTTDSAADVTQVFGFLSLHCHCLTIISFQVTYVHTCLFCR